MGILSLDERCARHRARQAKERAAVKAARARHRRVQHRADYWRDRCKVLTARVATLEQERRDGAWLSDPLPTDRRSLWHLVACYSQRVSEAREALNRIVLSR